MSYTSGKPQTAEVGELAPEVSIEKGDSVISLSDLRGKYVLVNYWSKSEPASRIDNHFYDKIVSELPDKNIAYISVCADAKDENLSRLVIDCDGNNISTQFMLSQTTGSDCSDIYIKEGPATWLVSPQGIIIAKNPSPELIAQL